MKYVIWGNLLNSEKRIFSKINALLGWLKSSKLLCSILSQCHLPLGNDFASSK